MPLSPKLFECKLVPNVSISVNNRFLFLRCFTTALHDHPWWVVDLKENKMITSVKIVHRGDCCGMDSIKYNLPITMSTKKHSILTTSYEHGFLISESRLQFYYVGVAQNFTEDTFDPRTMVRCLNHSEAISAGMVEHKYCDQPMTGRYVAIVVPGEQFLTLCEVMIYGQRGKQLHTQTKTLNMDP